ncbi:MAG: COG4280 domain-containing protein [Acidimicrobiales bacterium]
MSSSTWLLAAAVFGACAVEAVEALTIVLAAGVTRGWRSAVEGTLVALLVLAALVGAVGVPLVHYVPIAALRTVVGALLLVLGLQWLRKAVLRASGHKALHDEDAIYATTVAALSSGRPAGRDAMGFTVAFKGVFLEGMEVVLIVLTLGASARKLGVASLAAAAAVVLVTAIGLAVARQLSEVPENTIKTFVGIMLTSFGVFWTGEGIGVHWPGSDLWILALVGMFLLLTLVLVAGLRRRAESQPEAALAADAVPQAGRPVDAVPPWPRVEQR